MFANWSRCIVGMVLVLGVLAAFSASSEVPNEFNLQGRLLEPGGGAIAGSVNLTARIYDAVENGTLIYQEDHAGTLLDEGVFELVIGTGSSPVGFFGASTFPDANRFLELVVNGSSLLPRQPFRSVPYAFVAPLPLCTIAQNSETVFNENSFDLTAICDGSTQSTGGGFEITGSPVGVWILESSPRELLNAWTVRGINQSGETVEVIGWAKCCLRQF